MERSVEQFLRSMRNGEVCIKNFEQFWLCFNHLAALNFIYFYSKSNVPKAIESSTEPICMSPNQTSHNVPKAIESSTEPICMNPNQASHNVAKAIESSTEPICINPNQVYHAVKKTKKRNKRRMYNKFYCDICNVTVFCAEAFEMHLNGKKHRMKAPLSRSCEGIKYIHIYQHPGDNAVIKCELCGVELLDIGNHLNSSSHILEFLKANHPNILEYLQSRGLHNISETELKRIAETAKYLEGFQQSINSDNPAVVERISFYKSIKRNEDCEPPQKMLRMDDPHCNDISATISDLMKEKNSGIDQNEEKHSASDEKQIKSDCQKYKQCKTESNLKHNGFERPDTITCNKDFYNFLETFGVNDNKNPQKGKLKIADPAESVLQQADSTTTSDAKESTSYKSTDDTEDHCEGQPQEARFSSLAVSIKKEPESVFPPQMPISNPNGDKSILKKTIKSASSPLCSRGIFERNKNFGTFSEQNAPDFIASCQDQLPVKSSANVSSPSSSKVANSPLMTFSHLDFSTSDVSHISSSHHSYSIQSTTGIYSTFTEVMKTVSTNVKTKVQNKFYTSKENPASSLSVNEDEKAVCTPPLNCSQSSQEPSQAEKSIPCTVSDELHMSISGCSPSVTCTKKALGHSSMSKSRELSRDQPPSMSLDSFFTANKNSLIAAVEKRRFAHMNCLPSTSNTYDAYSITFGGKKNMQVSEVTAEVAKFADTKPFLKGIDVNQVVRILIQNRLQENRKRSHNSTA